MSTMSTGEVRARYDKLLKKGSLSGSEAAEVAICEAVLFNGGQITAQADYTEPKRAKGEGLSWWGL